MRQTKEEFRDRKGRSQSKEGKLEGRRQKEEEGSRNRERQNQRQRTSERRVEVEGRE
jgi:hypothetical protein